MRLSRTPLASALFAVLLLAALPAVAPSTVRAGEVYDIRRSSDYDPLSIDWIVKKYGYAYDAATGALTAPDGQRVSEAEADGVFYDDGTQALTERERAVLLSLGARRAVADGRPVLHEPDCQAPYTPLSITLIRRQIHDGLLAEASAPFDAAKLDAQTSAAYVSAYGYHRDGAWFRDRDEKIVTHGDLTQLRARVDATREPDVAELVRRAGYEVRRRGGAALLWSPEAGWLDRATADEHLKSVGLLAQRDPNAPFMIGADTPAEIQAALGKPPGSIGADGGVLWEGSPLTVADYRHLLEPVDPARLTAAQTIAVEIALEFGLGYEARPGEHRIIAPDGKTPLTRLDTGIIMANYGFAGQHSLDAPFDARVPAAASIVPYLVDVGLVLNPADGTLSRDGRVSTVGDIVAMFGYFDLASKDPGLTGAIESLLKGQGFDTRVVASRRFLCRVADAKCVTNEAMRGSIRGIANGEHLFTKTGLIAEKLKMAQAGKPLDAWILRHIDRIAGDEGGYLPPALVRTLARKSLTKEELVAAIDSGAEHDAHVWAAAQRLEPDENYGIAPPYSERARQRALAARDGSVRLSEELERAFADMYRGQGSRIVEEQRALFVNSFTGKAAMPFLALGGHDGEVVAHFDPNVNQIVFMTTPELARTLAAVALKSLPAAQRTPAEAERLARELEDPSKLGQALLADPAVLAAFTHEQAWNYIHEHGHALSFLKGPAAVERKGLMTVASWTDEEKVAFLWATRYTHELLSRTPGAEVPPHEIACYRRMLGGYDLWSVDIIREHLSAGPGRFASLLEARVIQAGWIERARRWVAAGTFPGAAKFLERLEQGSASMRETDAAYTNFFDDRTRLHITKMSVEGTLNMAARYSAGPQADPHMALRYQAAAPAALYAAIDAGLLSPSDAAELKARLPSGRSLIRAGENFAKTWRAQPPAGLSAAGAAASAARSLEALRAHCRFLRLNPRALADSGLTLESLDRTEALLTKSINRAWREANGLVPQEKSHK
jgi:hypothetical protein